MEFIFINGVGLAECQNFGSLAGAVSTTKPGGTTAFDKPDEVLNSMMKLKGKS